MKFQCPQWPPAWPEIAESVQRSLTTNDWGKYQSESKRLLVDRIANTYDVNHVRLISSGTAAIEQALRAANSGPGTEVILAAYDYPGNFRSIEQTGAKPVLIDINPTNLSLDASQLEQAASDRVVAVITSHLYGNPADIGEIAQVCKRKEWVLIEDACQVPGMVTGEAEPGVTADITALSFGGSKPLTAGNGGAILTNQARFASRIASFLDRPSDSQPLSPLQAAALLPQWDRLSEANQIRRATAKFIANLDLPWKTVMPGLLHGKSDPTFYKLAFLARDSHTRDQILANSASLGLPLGPGFRSMHRSSDRRCRKPSDLIHAQSVESRVFLLDHAALLLPPDRFGELAESLEILARSAA